MRMGAFLGDRGRLHQFAIDVLIDLSKRVNDLLRIILRDYGNGFLFSLRGLEAVAPVVSLVYGFAIGRTGSVVNARASSGEIVRVDFFVISFVGFLVTALALSFLAFCSGLFSFVITCTISFLVSCSALARFNADGARPCA